MRDSVGTLRKHGGALHAVEEERLAAAEARRQARASSCSSPSSISRRSSKVADLLRRSRRHYCRRAEAGKWAKQFDDQSEDLDPNIYEQILLTARGQAEERRSFCAPRNGGAAAHAANEYLIQDPDERKRLGSSAPPCSSTPSICADWSAWRIR
ncbi:hypothetical protein ACFSKT_17035 [Paenibacillus xanthanilyticus]|uniref:hypothetical protein n=1 Tax=Paenibacillus xanthanilyticus TaxID=1783531 RepID=UPI003632377A